MNTRRFQGFSLIELMVAMTIGIILTMLIGQIFINSRQIFASTDSLSRLQENARYALAILTREIRLSTYKADPRKPRYDIGGVAGSGAFGVATTNPTLGGTESGNGGATPTSGLPDVFWVRFQGSGTGTGTGGDGTVQDCTGARIDAPPATAPTTSVINAFFVQPDPANNNEPTLFCNTAGAGTCAAGAAGCIALIPGVENMQVTYGLDLTGVTLATLSPDGSIDRFVDANGVGLVSPPDPRWDNVLSIRISLLMRTDDRVANSVSATSYNMLGTTVVGPSANTDPTITSDARLRRVFTTVIDFRNRTQ